jgi:hypothetical protein
LSRPDHIFIVGLPRTGSTLTRAILNASTEIGIGSESHFFPSPIRLGLARREGYRERFARVGDLRSDDGLHRVVDTIWSLRGKSFWTRLAGIADRAEFETRLRASDRTDRALLELAMEYYARGKPIRGEKTPQHIHAVPTLLDWYPHARVIQTFRDPRAVYVSLQRKEERSGHGGARRLLRWLRPLLELYATTNVILAWRGVVDLHRRYEAQYSDRYLLQRFEDLVSDPRAAVERLCIFLEIPFAEQMLDVVVLNSSYLARGAASGFDRSALDRWRGQLSPFARRWFALLCGSRLREFGYEP